MNKWKEIWNQADRVNNHILEILIKADGFDSGAGSLSLQDWKNYTQEHYNKLSIQANDSIYDVGCGSGAFIFSLYLKNNKVGGTDYSSILIELANKVMRNADFKCNEASNLDSTYKYDIVTSHSVFHYFSSLDYAEKVVERMLLKSNKRVGIFDINDKSKEIDYYKIRGGGMNSQEYKKKYKGLNHFFYEKKWFEQIAKKHGLKIDIYDQSFESYSNSSLRFNVIIEK